MVRVSNANPYPFFNILRATALVYNRRLVLWQTYLLSHAKTVGVARTVQDELLLLHRAKSLDQEALAQIHEQYYDSIYRYMTYRVNDLQTAEDLTSEVFVRFLHAIQQKNAPQNTIRGWLFGTASLILKEHYRKKKRTQLTELSESLPGETVEPTEKLEVQENKEALREALTNLTEEQQQVLALRFGYEMSVRDVAETMNKSEGSIKMLQVRAIAALTRIMTDPERSK